MKQDGIEERCKKAKPEDVPGLLDELLRIGFGAETYAIPFFIADAAFKVGGPESAEQLMNLARELEVSPEYNFQRKEGGGQCRNLRLQRAVICLRRAAEAYRQRYTMEHIQSPAAPPNSLWPGAGD